MRIQSIWQKLTKSFVLLLVFTVLWTGIAINFIAPAQATTKDNLIAMESNPVDKVLGEGTTDKIEGKAEQDLGTVQKKVGDIKENSQGTIKQIKGRAKQDIGEVKSRLDEAGSDLEDASESTLDAVKSFFGQ